MNRHNIFAGTRSPFGHDFVAIVCDPGHGSHHCLTISK